MIAFAPYLNFDGRCEEAFRFYQQIFGGETVILWAFEDSPMAGDVPPDWRGKILHARLRVGESLLMGGDELPEDYARPQGFHVAIHPADPAEAARLFQALSEGGTVRMPLTPTFWAATFGMLDDRFGVPWMVSAGENV